MEHRYLMFCAFIVFKLARCYIVRSKLEGHIIAAIFFTFLVYTKSYKCFSCNYNATHFCLIGGSIRRQIANPTRPTRTLTSFTRGVRRGGENQGVDANGNSLDFSTKLLHLAWHPTENSIACAAANSLYMYYA